MDKFQIETAQNVNIVQNVAGVGERILAYLIDGLIMVCYVILMLVLFSIIEFDYESSFIISLTASLPLFVYHLLWETFWNGASPGKAAMKLRVVKLDGSKPAFSNFLIRWLFRIIEITISFGSLALITVLFNGRGQRLGDIAAKTTLITERKLTSFSQTLLTEIPEDYTPKYPQVTVFSDSEMQTIKTIYNKEKRRANHKIILKLAAKVSSEMEIKFDEKPIQFIDTVIKDYNYYTQQV